MKKIALIAMMPVLGFVACKKNYSVPDPSSSVYYVKASIDGTNVEYDYTGALYQNPATLNIYGCSSNAANADGINILFQLIEDNNNAQVGVGAYTDTANVLDAPVRPDSSNNNSPGYINTNEVNITVQQLGLEYTSDGVADAMYSTPFSCSITAINGSTVSGTFSGTAYFGYTGTIGKTVKITNGRFYVQF